MRNLEQLKFAKSEHEATIAKYKKDDYDFPSEPIYGSAIRGLEEAVQYLDGRIKKEKAE